MSRRQDTRTRIVQTALRLFASRGYDGTGISEILRESGCTRGVLYHYFSSKEELGYAVIDEEMRLIREQGAFSYLASNEHFVDRLLKLVDSLPNTLTLETGDTVVTGLAPRMAIMHEGFRRRMLVAQRAFLEEFKKMVSRAVAEGQLRESVDPSQLGHFMVGFRKRNALFHTRKYFRYLYGRFR